MNDSVATIKRNATSEWKIETTAHANSQRAQLLKLGTGELPKCLRKFPVCHVTGKCFNKEQQLQLTRIRSGHSELFGFFHAQLRGCPNACRFCTTIRREPIVVPPTDPSEHPSVQRFRCYRCTYSFKSVSELQKHQTRCHPECVQAKDKFPCMFCGKEWPNTRSRSRHLVTCIKKVNDPDTQQIDAEDLMQIDTEMEETIPHFLQCHALQESRDKHSTNAYLRAYGSRYFYSTKSLRWVHSLTNGTYATEEDDQEERVLPPSYESDEEEEGEEKSVEESEKYEYEEGEEEEYDKYGSYEVGEYEGELYD
eukprot:Tbor_TRINITY_DN6018_c1_g1::TRINITY_DN6018_c1_g1_i8::g.10165::m.10165